MSEYPFKSCADHGYLNIREVIDSLILSFRLARHALCLIGLFALSQTAWAVEVTLAWDANSEPDIAGYVLYAGLEPGNYVNRFDVGPATTQLVSGLTEGHTYYFAVTAYNVSGLESDPSLELAVAVSRDVPDPPTYLNCYSVKVGDRLVVTNAVLGEYTTAEALRFEATGPDDARFRINATNGVFSWVPAPHFASSTQYFDVTVTSDGLALPTERRTLCVIVNDYAVVELGSMMARAGENANVLLGIYSSTGLTNLCVNIQYPQDRLANLSLVNLNPLVCSAILTPVSNNVVRACFSTCPGIKLEGWNTMGQLRVSALPQNSAFAPFCVIGTSALRADGQPVSHVVGRDGRGIVIGNEPLLETSGNPDGTVWLTLYGKPGATYQILRAGNVWPQPSWQPVTRIVLSGLFQRFQVANDAHLACFIAYEER
jgi:hypothetical protein